MQVNVINENNVEVSIDPPQTIVVEVDQGKQGRGLTNISYQQEGEYYSLVVTYTDGPTEQLGPLIITGAAASLLGVRLALSLIRRLLTIPGLLPLAHKTKYLLQVLLRLNTHQALPGLL